ncbi:MAG: tetratricopeptide repeat protein [Nitrospira sp.]|nr:tetratricopeptide repeat protein [Nitrospira sp.]
MSVSDAFLLSLNKLDWRLLGITAIVLCEAFVGGMSVCYAAEAKNLQNASPTAEALYQEGLARRQNQDYKFAAEKFSEAIARGKKTADTYTYLGEMLIQLERHGEACATLSEAIRLDPENVRAYGFRAIALEQLGKREEAIQDYSAALVKAPDELIVSLLEARGNTYWAMDMLDKAAEDFEAIIVHDPKDPRGYLLRGKLLGAKGKFREAIDDLSLTLPRFHRHLYKEEFDEVEGSMSTKTRRQYTEEFKTEAVQVGPRLGTTGCADRDLGIADHLLYRWRVEQQQAEERGKTRQDLRAEEAELVRLRRENAVLKQERDF